ncbi:MAG: hypothetical protein ACJ79P_04010 [Myxococcales bacterium]
MPLPGERRARARFANESFAMRAAARAMHAHRLAPAIAGQGEKRAMANAALWLVLVPVVAGFLAIVFLLWQGVSLERPFYVETRRLICPRFGREVVATVVRSRPSGKVLGVQSCTGLSDPDRITCGEECVGAVDKQP